MHPSGIICVESGGARCGAFEPAVPQFVSGTQVAQILWILSFQEAEHDAASIDKNEGADKL
jgi:hypothetical protein